MVLAFRKKGINFSYLYDMSLPRNEKITEYKKHSSLKCEWQSRKGQKYFSSQEFRQIGNVKVLYDHHKDYFCKGT